MLLILFNNLTSNHNKASTKIFQNTSPFHQHNQHHTTRTNTTSKTKMPFQVMHVAEKPSVAKQLGTSLYYHPIIKPNQDLTKSLFFSLLHLHHTTKTHHFNLLFLSFFSPQTHLKSSSPLHPRHPSSTWQLCCLEHFRISRRMEKQRRSPTRHDLRSWPPPIHRLPSSMEQLEIMQSH